jgi:hypothetical protein
MTTQHRGWVGNNTELQAEWRKLSEALLGGELGGVGDWQLSVTYGADFCHARIRPKDQPENTEEETFFIHLQRQGVGQFSWRSSRGNNEYRAVTFPALLEQLKTGGSQ